MSQGVLFDKDNQAVLLYSSDRNSWEDKTDSVTEIQLAYYYGNTSGYVISFKGSVKKFFYKKENVRIIEKIQEFDISKFDVLIDGKKIEVERVDKFQENYFCLIKAGKKLLSNKVSFESNKYKDIYEYYKRLAEYSGTIVVNDSPLFFLSLNYKRISSALDDSVLVDFLKGKCKPVYNEKDLIFPFDFNQSQLKAIESALSHNISVIEGPPGTGKTQTILNLIANILYLGKNCAVISNNNAAINNVYEKLQEEGLGFIAASLGNVIRVC